MPIGGPWPHPISFHQNGRSALRAWWEERNRPSIWLPSYICPELVEAVPNARFYPVHADLTPDEAYVRSHIKAGESAVVVHYFGHPAGFEPFRSQHTLIIEDFSHGILGSTARGPIGSLGSISFASLSKVTDMEGGMLIREPWEAKDVLKDLYDMDSFRENRNARRANYIYLDRDVPKSWKMYPFIDEAACPVAYPIRHPKRDALRAFLKEREIYCPVHWELPQEVQNGPYLGSRALSREILSLPIDARYTTTDMVRVVEALEDYASQG